MVHTTVILLHCHLTLAGAPLRDPRTALLPGSAVAYWVATGSAWLPATVRRHDAALELYEWGCEVFTSYGYNQCWLV